MPRTAITIGKTRKGEWLFLSTPDDNFIEQRKNFRQIRADKTHKDLAVVIYQENDGIAETIRLSSPADKKKLDAQRDASLETAKTLGEANRGETNAETAPQTLTAEAPRVEA